MIGKQLSNLAWIECEESITEEKHSQFLYHLKCALLLALQDAGEINTMQFRHAEDKLKQQYRKRLNNLQEQKRK